MIDPADYPAKNGNIPAGWTNDAIRAARDEARSNGLTPILPWDNVALSRMVDAAKEFVARTSIAEAFKRGKPEISLFYDDDGAQCRARLDLYDEETGTVIDYKTTDDVSPRTFARKIISMRYYLQSVFYSRALHCVGKPFSNFVFLAQSIYPPHDCTLHMLSPDMEAIGNSECQRAIEIWKRCAESNKWPGYGTQLNWVEAPAWLLAQEEASK